MKFNNLDRENKHFQPQIEKAIQEVIKSGKYLFGEQTEQLEQNFRGLTGKMYAISVKNATDAITMVSKWLNYAGSKSYSVPEFGAYPTYIALKNALMHNNILFATDGGLLGRYKESIEFTDIDDSLTIDPTKLKFDSRKVVVAVDLFGNETNIKAIKQKLPHAFIIHDCAQATCSKRDYNYSDAVIFSFYPTKPLAAMGDGGMICTNNKELAQWLYKHRFYGYEADGSVDFVGVNSRMDEIQAAILNIKYEKLDEMNAKRVAIAKKYSNALPFGVQQMKASENCIYHQFPVILGDKYHREQFIEKLIKARIPYIIHYPRMVRELEQSNATKANPISERIVSLPCNAFMSNSEVNKVVKFLQNL